MRGKTKTILWISLAAVLLIVMMPNFAAAGTTTVYVDPALTLNDDLSKEFFDININIMDVVDLYAFGFTVKFAPYARVLVVSSVTEGPFLKQGGTTYFKYTIDTFKGEIKIGDSLLGAVPGVSGSGTLVTVKFRVVEAGKSAIELIDKVLLDSTLSLIPHVQLQGYYLGPTVSITKAHSCQQQVVPTKAVQEKVGDGDGTTTVFKLGHAPIIANTEEIYVDSVLQTRDTDYTIDAYNGIITFMSAPILGAEIRANYAYIWYELKLECHMKNEGKVTLQVQGIFDCYRVEDGKHVRIGAGQWLSTAIPRETEYLYVNDFDFTRTFWTPYGESPYLNEIEDGNYIEGTYDTAQHRWFHFEDLTLGPLDFVAKVTLEGYCDGPYDEDVDFDIYSQNFNWIGSLYAPGEPKWVTPRWIGAPASDAEPSLLTEAGINNFMCLAYFYDPAGHGGAGNIIDCLRLKVEFTVKKPLEPPWYEVAPNTGFLFPEAIWALNSLDRGTWVCTTTVYYTHYGFSVNSETWEKTFTWFTKAVG